MLKLVLVTVFCVEAFARPNTQLPIEPHIINGTQAKEGQFPFVVSFRFEDNKQHHCGGALISDRYVVTARHCLDEPGQRPSRELIGVGSVNLGSQKLYKIEKFIMHPHFDIWPLFDDIALVKLSSPVPLGDNVQTILPYLGNDTFANKPGTPMGWGYTTFDGPISNTLLYINNSTILSNKECQKRIPSYNRVSFGDICILTEAGRGPYLYDSGSPLIHKAADGKNYVVGVCYLSIFGPKYTVSVYTRVSHYAEWIKENMK